MDFSNALEAVRFDGGHVRRKAWHAGTQIFYQGARDGFVPFIAVSTWDGKLGHWTPIACDLLAEDWERVE